MLCTQSIRSSIFAALFGLFALVQPCVGQSLDKPLKVENFTLIDQAGEAHELYYYQDKRAIVFMVHGNGCQIVRSNLAEYKSLKKDFAARGVEFLMINSNMQDSRSAIAEEALEWGVELPILHDASQVIGKSLDLTRTGEVLVIDPKTWNVVYRGALSDRVDYERQKNTADIQHARLALESVLSDKPVTIASQPSPGCIINYADELRAEKKSDISYSQTIAPLLKKNCTACHIEGGIAPWAMSEYAMVRGFAPMIREVIRTKRMPPWHSDPNIGHWVNDKSLTDSEVRSLISWIDAGAPRGQGDDPLKEIGPLDNQWSLGEPDLIIDIPQFEVPATGVVDYQFPSVKNPLDRDVWIVGAAIIPGDPQAVHHILAGSSERELTDDRVENIFENFILTYAPGNESYLMPKGTGVFVPKGGVFQFQMHYTPYGKVAVDRSKIGFYFAEKPPANFFREHVLVNTDIEIPAHAERHEEHAYFDFWDDATIYALFPHAHYRGRSSSFELVFPNGETEMLLSVPNYDFNWQRTYAFQEPKQVPAGTRIIHRTIYDNSAKNRGNPDPSDTVKWGLQSEQEMLYGSMSYSWANESSDKPIHRRGLARISQIMGAWDRDISGRLSEQELPENIRKKLGDGWKQFDEDGDGGLAVPELGKLLRSMQKS